MKKLLPVAVAAALAGVNSAQAVHVNPDGQGQVLLYPYYTVEGGQDTYINVVNTTSEVKAVKVRFLESMNSREVLDFNLYLSPQDHWSAVITADAGGDGATIITADTSCTVPGIPAGGQPFRTFAYAGDSGPQGVDRTREGYVEMIEMGVVTGDHGDWATHVANGPPASCGSLVSSWDGGIWSGNGGDSNTDLTGPTGGLYGYGVLIDVAEGTDATYDALALDDFSADNLHNRPGTELPNLNTSTQRFWTLFNGGSIVTGTASRSLDAVSAVLMVSSIDNDYVLEPSIAAGTDFVITFPTKREYVAVTPAEDPFTTPWANGSSCEAVDFTYYDREENRIIPSGLDFSPEPPGDDPFSLCAEANVLTFNGSNVLKASSRTGSNLAVDFDNGWINIDFTSSTIGVRELDAGEASGDILKGLPAIGFAVQKYVNGDLGGLLSNYAGSVTHKGERLVSNVVTP